MDASGLGGPARAYARAALRGRRLGRRQRTIARKTARSRTGSMQPVAGSVMAARYIRVCDAASASTRRFKKPGWRAAGGLACGIDERGCDGHDEVSVILVADLPEQ